MAGSRNGNLVLSDMVLKAAKAVTYTQGKMKLGAVNKGGDFRRAPLQLLACTSRTRDGIDGEVMGMAKTGKIRNYWGDQIDVSARWAGSSGCGNCNEQSTIAFVYLRDVLKVRPLDWMAYNGASLIGSHAFVIVGRTEGLPTADNSPVSASDLNGWNATTVMCDAYAGEVYDYPTLKEKLHTKKDLLLRYRLE